MAKGFEIRSVDIVILVIIAVVVYVAYQIYKGISGIPGAIASVPGAIGETVTKAGEKYFKEVVVQPKIPGSPMNVAVTLAQWDVDVKKHIAQSKNIVSPFPQIPIAKWIGEGIATSKSPVSTFPQIPIAMGIGSTLQQLGLLPREQPHTIATYPSKTISPGFVKVASKSFIGRKALISLQAQGYKPREKQYVIKQKIKKGGKW